MLPSQSDRPHSDRQSPRLLTASQWHQPSGRLLTRSPCCTARRLSAEHDNPAALQEALLEEEKHSGVSYWIGSKIPASVHNNKIWRTIFWVRMLQSNKQLPVPAECRQFVMVLAMAAAVVLMRCQWLCT